MTDQEARQLFRDLFRVFPSIHQWLERTDDPEMTFGRWRGLLFQTHWDDAEAVLEGLYAGRYHDAPTTAEPDRWPIWIVKKASEFAGERYERRENARVAAQARGGFDQDRLVHFLAQDVHEKKDPTGKAKQIRLTDPRYRCDICRDTGQVEVWAGIVIHKILGGKPIDRLKTYNVACTCERGEGLRTGNKRWTAVPEYDPEVFCRVIAPSWDDLAGLVEWLDGRGAMVPEPVPGGRFVEEVTP